MYTKYIARNYLNNPMTGWTSFIVGRVWVVLGGEVVALRHDQSGPMSW